MKVLARVSSPAAPHRPVRRLAAPPRIVRWRALVYVVRTILVLVIAGAVLLAAFSAKKAYTDTSAAAAMKEGGVLAKAKLTGWVDEPAEIKFGYRFDGGWHTRTAPIPSARARVWRHALLEATFGNSSFGSNDMVPIPIQVRIPPANPDGGEPVVSEDPEQVPNGSLDKHVVIGAVKFVRDAYRRINLVVEGTTPPIAFEDSVSDRETPVVGTIYDVVYIPPDPTHRHTLGAVGSLFPTTVQSFGAAVLVGLTLVLGVLLPVELQYRRRRRLMASGVETAVRIVTCKTDWRWLPLWIFSAAAAVLTGGRVGIPLLLPKRRTFEMQDGAQVRTLARSSNAALPIPTNPGDFTSVLVDPSDRRRLLFVDDVLASLRAVPTPGANASPA